ncbi:PTS glucose/sucrose transporter subunit IIB [Phocoenobacter skyensis]|uniref:PTS glucose/sucrose transporter subunit IIB n=1 Tax=Phocoenobacter skyensis TaxID=97481 RepID=A0ABT9JI28_9PAST|nr:PTS glucose/sucrose transporter subunit IIB [Pasteurella skyensis]MDP8078437.1 PTS glucose/sucrose transporter subunit IIB [Pasteurella skyensis]MDP8084471.1 PTS glucose/sucrose transporter subunit IIB [Pasteurella skyensis]
MSILNYLKCPFSKKSKIDNNVQLTQEEKASQLIDALGGVANIETIDACLTRLRVILKDRGLVNKAKLTQLGSKGNIKEGHNGLQVIVGSGAVRLTEIIKTQI